MQQYTYVSNLFRFYSRNEIENTEIYFRKVFETVGILNLLSYNKSPSSVTCVIRQFSL